MRVCIYIFILFVCLTLQMAGLQVGRKIYTINEDLLFLRPFSEVETMISQAFCVRRSLRLLVATKAKEWGNLQVHMNTSTHKVGWSYWSFLLQNCEDPRQPRQPVFQTLWLRSSSCARCQERLVTVTRKNTECSVVFKGKRIPSASMWNGNLTGSVVKLLTSALINISWTQLHASCSWPQHWTSVNMFCSMLMKNLCQ